MQAGQGVCLFCRNYLRRSSAPQLRRRQASSATRIKGVYDASKLVLDLEAADSKYVRRFEDNLKGAATRVFEETHKTTSASTIARPKYPWHPSFRSQATPPDYFNYALVGNPFASGAESQVNLRRVMIGNRISPKNESFTDDIKFLRHFSGPVLPAPISDFFPKCLNNARNIYETKRAISLIADIQGGCEFLSSNGHAILDKLRGTTLVDRVKYINTLVQMFQSRGLGPGSILVEAGMHFAAEEGLLQPLQRYIDIAAIRQYPVGSRRAKSIEAFAMIMSRLNTTSSDENVPSESIYGRTGLWAKRDALKVMTGWEIGGIPEKGEERKSSFATIIDTDQRSYRAYIRGLAILEAGEALQYEFLHPNPINYSDEKRALLFASAFRSAYGVQLALDVCKTMLNASSRELAAEVVESGAHQSPSFQRINSLTSQKRIMESLLLQKDK